MVAQADGYWGWDDTTVSGFPKNERTIIDYNSGTKIIADEDGCIDTVFGIFYHTGSAADVRAALDSVVGSDTDLVNESPVKNLNLGDTAEFFIVLDSSYFASNSDEIMVVWWGDEGPGSMWALGVLKVGERTVNQSTEYDNGSPNAWEDPLTAPSAANSIIFTWVHYISGACAAAEEGPVPYSQSVKGKANSQSVIGKSWKQGP